MRLAEEETRRRIEVRLRERQDGELLEQQRRSDVSEGDLAANKEGVYCVCVLCVMCCVSRTQVMCDN